MSSHVKHEYNMFIKQVSRINLNMTQICLASTHSLFINKLIMLGSWVVSDFTAPKYKHIFDLPKNNLNKIK